MHQTAVINNIMMANGFAKPASTRFNEIQLSMNIASQAQRDHQVTRFAYEERDSITPGRSVKPIISWGQESGNG